MTLKGAVGLIRGLLIVDAFKEQMRIDKVMPPTITDKILNDLLLFWADLYKP
jgi:hypothetical protein